MPCLSLSTEAEKVVAAQQLLPDGSSVESHVSLLPGEVVQVPLQVCRADVVKARSLGGRRSRPAAALSPRSLVTPPLPHQT